MARRLRPRPGDVARVAAMDLEEAVLSLTRPTGTAPMTGDAPTVDGAPLSPLDTWYGDHLYWFDRMVRSGHQLVERLALVFHDWWATSNDSVGSNAMMLAQTNIFRAHGLGSFRDMTRAVTTDPAMLVFLNGIDNRRNAVNENYARELMELFTLGADRGAYTETDVRELARSLTGWRADWSSAEGLHDFRYDAARWDSGSKTVFGTTGAWKWEDACRLVVEHPLHPSFFVSKLWSYFIPKPPSAGVRAKLEQLYVARATGSAPCWRRSSARPSSTPARAWSSRPRSSTPGCCARTEVDHRRGMVVAVRRRRTAALRPARRLGLGRRAMEEFHTARGALGHRQLRPRRPHPASRLREARRTRPRRRRRRSTRRSPSGSTRTWRRRPAPGCSASRATSSRRPTPPARPPGRKTQRAQLRTQRQTALRHLIAVSADYQTC